MFIFYIILSYFKIGFFFNQSSGWHKCWTGYLTLPWGAVSLGFWCWVFGFLVLGFSFFSRFPPRYFLLCLYFSLFIFARCFLSTVLVVFLLTARCCFQLQGYMTSHSKNVDSRAADRGISDVRWLNTNESEENN